MAKKYYDIQTKSFTSVGLNAETCDLESERADDNVVNLSMQGVNIDLQKLSVRMFGTIARPETAYEPDVR